MILRAVFLFSTLVLFYSALLPADSPHSTKKSTEKSIPVYDRVQPENSISDAEEAIQATNQNLSAEQSETHWQKTKQGADSVWKETKKTSNEAWVVTKEGSQKAWDSTKESSEEVWKITKDGSKKAWDGTKETSSDAWKATKEYSNKAWDATKSAVHDGADYVSDKTK